VVITDEELEALEPEKTRDIDLRRFVDRDAIPPVFFERAYFLTPAGQSTKAYRLLAATMERTQPGRDRNVRHADQGVPGGHRCRERDPPGRNAAVPRGDPTRAEIGLPERPRIPAARVAGAGEGHPAS
jgi:hypothetical protein